MSIKKAPDDGPKQEILTKPISEKKIQAFINKGGKPTGRGEDSAESNGLKGIKVNFKTTELEAIKTLRDKRPSSRSRKIPISIHDWVIEAVQEKIKRDQKKYDLKLI